MSIDDVARITKIQPRILERLEAGRFDGLPAEVFVRGFVRSFARCVGRAEDEALRRYAACASAPATIPGHQIPASIVVTKSEVPPAPLASGSIAALPIPAEIAPERPSRHRNKKRRGKRNKRRATATGTPSQPSPVVEAVAPEPETEPETTEFARIELEPEPSVDEAGEIDVPDVAIPAPEAPETIEATEPIDEPVATETWQPTMPAPQPWVPWRRSGYVAVQAAPSAPSLVIDDSDPDSAERVLEERAQKDPPRRSFLPPILLDREDRAARQGGLTLAVILLLIAATLTLSYLMRRPSAAGDGMTMRDVPASNA